MRPTTWWSIGSSTSSPVPSSWSSSPTISPSSRMNIILSSISFLTSLFYLCNASFDCKYKRRPNQKTLSCSMSVGEVCGEAPPPCDCGPPPVPACSPMPYNLTTCGVSAHRRGPRQRVVAFTYFRQDNTAKSEENRQYFQGTEVEGISVGVSLIWDQKSLLEDCGRDWK